MIVVVEQGHGYCLVMVVVAPQQALVHAPLLAAVRKLRHPIAE